MQVCELQSSTLPNGQILNVIDTPGLFSLSPSTEFTCREILRCLALTKDGIDAVLLVFSLRLTEEEKICAFHALEDNGDTFEEYLNDCPDFKEILEACNDRIVLFENKTKAPEIQKAQQVQEVLNYVEEIARTNEKPYMDDLSHEIRENETAFQEKQRQILEMKVNQQEMSHMIKDMVESHENQQLSHMMERVETKLKDTQTRLEQQLKEEQAARLEMEKRANRVEKHSSDVVNRLRRDLERADRMIMQVKTKSNKCIIL
ncbi:unnamed protein product [Arabidopsis lyrata]|uniref:AIG1-type G domain-containing protein n=1 Tax=Arabidopsis lyrata subsp. lyrata TaxID=81972 RepID=D7LXY9_ARALL|nr:hypothetical protein ARALYDRAFT_911269 [Arabidopsis lyrata subsp. lyrata]CAH8272773.1 unnamed protein product [Arabidopsis lyrata]